MLSLVHLGSTSQNSVIYWFNLLIYEIGRILSNEIIWKDLWKCDSDIEVRSLPMLLVVNRYMSGRWNMEKEFDKMGFSHFVFVVSLVSVHRCPIVCVTYYWATSGLDICVFLKELDYIRFFKDCSTWFELKWKCWKWVWFDSNSSWSVGNEYDLIRLDSKIK